MSEGLKLLLLHFFFLTTREAAWYIISVVSVFNDFTDASTVEDTQLA